jgi:hypothetical protein
MEVKAAALVLDFAGLGLVLCTGCGFLFVEREIDGDAGFAGLESGENMVRMAERLR